MTIIRHALWLATVVGEIKSRFDSVAIWIATKIRFRHCAIRFKYHAIWYWFDSNFNNSIQETRDMNRNLEVMVEIEYSFSLLTTQSDLIFKCLVLPSLMYARNNSLSAIIRGRLWTARSMHVVKALLRKWKFQWLLLAGAVYAWTWLTGVMFCIKTN